MQCFLDTRALKQASHQGKALTKASKPPNSNYLLLVEVPRAESLVDEVLSCFVVRGVVELVPADMGEPQAHQADMGNEGDSRAASP